MMNHMELPGNHGVKKVKEWMHIWPEASSHSASRCEIDISRGNAISVVTALVHSPNVLLSECLILSTHW